MDEYYIKLAWFALYLAIAVVVVGYCQLTARKDNNNERKTIDEGTDSGSNESTTIPGAGNQNDARDIPK